MSAPIIQITEPPSKSDTQNIFDTKTEAMLDSLVSFIDSANASLVAIGLNHRSTSTSSVSMGAGSKTFTVDAGLGYMVGMYLNISYADDITKHMQGVVSSYNSTTGQLIVNVQEASANSGSYANWVISVAVRPSSNNALPSATTTGTSSAYVANLGSSVLSIEQGKAYAITFHTACAANATLSVNGLLPALDIKTYRSDGTLVPVAAGDIGTNDTLIGVVAQSGTSFVVTPVRDKANFSYISTNTTLTLASALDVNFVVTAFITLTLPLLSTFAEGSGFTVTSHSSMLVACQGADSLLAAGDTGVGLTMKRGETYYITKSNGVWLITFTGVRDYDPLAIATTSGLTHEFNSIPVSIGSLELNLVGVSTNGTSIPLIQFGTTSGWVTTGYSGALNLTSSGGTGTSQLSSGIPLDVTWAASYVKSGTLNISISGNTVIFSGGVSGTDSQRVTKVFGHITLGSALTRVRLQSGNGTDTFDAGSLILKGRR